MADQARVKRRCISFAAGACGLVALGMLFEVGDSVQMRFQDLWYGIRGSREPSPQVVIVAIDGRTLNAANERWPWRRDLYAPLVKRLDEAGARVITFEVAFSKATEEDEVLASAMEVSGNVLFGMVFNDAGDRSPPGVKPPGYLESQALPPFAVPLSSVLRAPALEPPARRLTEAAAAVGHVVGLPGPDGTLRAIPMLIQHGDRAYPSLALQAARIYVDVALDEVTASDVSFTWAM